MKRTFASLLFVGSLLLSVPGCGDSEPTNVGENADQTAIQEYDALLEADQQSLGADAPEDL